MQIKFSLTLPIVHPLVSAICPGYNYAFWNRGHNWFYTSDDSCNIVVTGHCQNVCHCKGNWGCGPSHSVDKLLVNGLWYACRREPNAGICDDNANQLAYLSPESCCRNDGRRNFEEGLITKRHADAIAETDILLERHGQEYEDAERQGHDVAELRRRQLDEVEEYMKWETEAAALNEE
ncbi:hypothetical protein N7456_005281 [Penicillium angulare]|uniref:Uncharacterized protein n=1 Tax=Penicillium angulare TaxID=116970 RepID=A0A9W9FY84_9EURO|nr:hypothetical protein N7456_005281 [Penicillium angulare]